MRLNRTFLGVAAQMLAVVAAVLIAAGPSAAQMRLVRPDNPGSGSGNEDLLVYTCGCCGKKFKTGYFEHEAVCCHNGSNADSECRRALQALEAEVARRPNLKPQGEAGRNAMKENNCAYVKVLAKLFAGWKDDWTVKSEREQAERTAKYEEERRERAANDKAERAQRDAHAKANNAIDDQSRSVRSMDAAGIDPAKAAAAAKRLRDQATAARSKGDYDGAAHVDDLARAIDQKAREAETIRQDKAATDAVRRQPNEGLNRNNREGLGHGADGTPPRPLVIADDINEIVRGAQDQNLDGTEPSPSERRRPIPPIPMPQVTGNDGLGEGASGRQPKTSTDRTIDDINNITKHAPGATSPPTPSPQSGHWNDAPATPADSTSRERVSTSEARGYGGSGADKSSPPAPVPAPTTSGAGPSKVSLDDARAYPTSPTAENKPASKVGLDDLRAYPAPSAKPQTDGAPAPSPIRVSTDRNTDPPLGQPRPQHDGDVVRFSEPRGAIQIPAGAGSNSPNSTSSKPPQIIAEMGLQTSADDTIKAGHLLQSRLGGDVTMIYNQPKARLANDARSAWLDRGSGPAGREVMTGSPDFQNASTQRMADMIEQNVRSGQPANVLVHSEGEIVFFNAVSETARSLGADATLSVDQRLGMLRMIHGESFGGAALPETVSAWSGKLGSYHRTYHEDDGVGTGLGAGSRSDMSASTNVGDAHSFTGTYMEYLTKAQPPLFTRNGVTKINRDWQKAGK